MLVNHILKRVKLFLIIQKKFKIQMRAVLCNNKKIFHIIITLKFTFSHTFFGDNSILLVGEIFSFSFFKKLSDYHTNIEKPEAKLLIDSLSLRVYEFFSYGIARKIINLLLFFVIAVGRRLSYVLPARTNKFSPTTARRRLSLLLLYYKAFNISRASVSRFCDSRRLT